MFNYTFHWNQALKALPSFGRCGGDAPDRHIVDVIGPACAIELTCFGFPATGSWCFRCCLVEVARNTPGLVSDLYGRISALSISAFTSAPIPPFSSASAFNNAVISQRISVVR